MARHAAPSAIPRCISAAVLLALMSVGCSTSPIGTTARDDTSATNTRTLAHTPTAAKQVDPATATEAKEAEAKDEAGYPLPAPAREAEASDEAGYPPPAPTQNDVVAGLWAPGEHEAEVLEALPAGAVTDPDDVVYWHANTHDLRGLMAVSYTVEGQPSVAAILVRPPRLLWDLRRDAGLDVEVTEAWPLKVKGAGVKGAGPGIAIGTPDGAQLITLSFEGKPHVVETLPLPASVQPSQVDDTLPTLVSRDLTGDDTPDLALFLPETSMAEPMLVLYERSQDGSARLVESAGRGAMLLDFDGDGVPELITPDGEGMWSRLVWQGDAFERAETLTDVSAPTPTVIVDGDLPQLPGQLTFAVQGEGAVKRWPREGGALRTLWQAGSSSITMRGLDVSEESGHSLLALAESDTGEPGLALLDELRGTAIDLPTHGALRGYTISPDGRYVAYVGLGVGEDGSPLPSSESTLHDPGGTVFVVATTNPAIAMPVGPCAAVEAHEGWTVGCLGTVVASADGSRFAYADGKGLWEVGVDGAPPRMVIEQYYTERDGPGSRVYRPVRWSPDGRRLLAGVGGWEGGSPAVVDLESGDAQIIRAAWTYGGPTSEQVWFPDGSALFVTRWTPDTEAQPELRVVDSASVDNVVPVLDVVPLSGATRYSAYGPAVTADGELRFGLRHTDDTIWQGNGIFRTASDGSERVRIAALPPLPQKNGPFGIGDPGTLTWSLDGEAFVARYDEGNEPRVLVGLADGSGLWDASAVLGDAEWITWSR